MSPTRCLSVLGVAVGLLVPANARGDDPTKRQCIDANVQAQKQQKDGKAPRGADVTPAVRLTGVSGSGSQ